MKDIPRYVETNDLLAYEGSVRLGDDKNFVVFSEEDELGSIIGVPERDHVEQAARKCETLLCFDDNIVSLKALPSLAVFHKQPASILEARADLGRPVHEVRALQKGDFAHVPAELHEELTDALDDERPLVGAFDGERAVAFCYVASQSARYWDVSIDTLETHRRKGFAMSAVRGLAATLEKTPVWGAAADNPASLHLAQKLGFVVVDELWVMER